MSLAEALRKSDKKGLFKSTDTFASYSTGYLPLDFANGFVYRKIDSDGKETALPILGIIGGTFTTFIGYSGSGKTTLADQIGWNIVKPFENGLLIHVDIEKTALKERMLQVTGASQNDDRIILQKEATSIEDVLDMIDDICEAKEKLGEDAKYILPEYMWRNGKKETFYQPTVIILDSLAVFNSRERKEDTLEGQMSSGREASQIAQFYSKCLNKMTKYNILIFSINHIKAKVDANPYQAAPLQVMMLRQGESMPRGYAPIYLAQNIFRCTATKGNIYTMDDDGFTGFMCNVQVVKSKTSFVGSTINACFNSAIGFDPIYTMYEYAVQLGLIEGRNPNLYLKGLDAFKFNRKYFRKKFIEEKEFRDGFMNILEPFMKSMVSAQQIDDVPHYISLDDLKA